MKYEVKRSTDDTGQPVWFWVAYSSGDYEVARSPEDYGTSEKAQAALGRFVSASS